MNASWLSSARILLRDSGLKLSVALPPNTSKSLSAESVSSCMYTEGDSAPCFAEIGQVVPRRRR